MTDLLKRWLAPPYSQLTAVATALVAIAAEFTDPATMPLLTGVFGPTWTKYLVALCALILLVSKAVERKQAPKGPQVVP